MDLSELERSLRKALWFNKATLACLCQMILSLINYRTVDLSQLAAGLHGHALLASKQRRLKRLLRRWPEQIDWLGPWLLGWFYDEHEKISLTMDRTNWKIGQVNVNFLVVGVVYRRIAIPLLFVLLEKQGNSNTSERIALTERVLKHISKERIVNILADREFVGEGWFAWLNKNDIPFKIRVKHNYLSTNSRGLEVVVDALFYGLKPGERLSLQGKRLLLGQWVYLSGSRLPCGELMIVASPVDDGCAITMYCERWEIETFFQNLKSRGFNLEDTHIIKTERLTALFQILMLATCWCIKSGEWIIEQGRLIALKNHGRPSKSLFRHGLDAIREAVSARFGRDQQVELLRLWQFKSSPACPFAF